MVKNITLTSSMRSNLHSLKTIASQMDKTQNILSTGKKVNSAIDNASSYYQSCSLTNRANDLNSLLDSMGQGIQTIQAATKGLESATAYLEQMKSIAEQALSLEETPLQSKVELVDNANILKAQGYHEINSGMSAQDIMDLMTSLKTAGQEIKLVLTEDIKLDDYFVVEFDNVTINGGGHTFTHNGFDIYGSSVTIQNMSIKHDGIFYGILCDGENFNLKNVDIQLNFSDNTEGCAVYTASGITVENVNIYAIAEENITGIYSWNNDVNLTHLTMTLESKNGIVTGIYSTNGYNESSPKVTIDGIEITTNSAKNYGIIASGEIIGIEEFGIERTMPQSLTDGKANTDSINDTAANLTKNYYKGDINGKFGKGQWYLPSIVELMDLYGTNYDAMKNAWSSTDGNGYNLEIVNNTLLRLADDGIASQIKKSYWSSTEYSSSHVWTFNMSDGSRDGSQKNYINYAFNPRYVRAMTSIQIDTPDKPKSGDIMYTDGSWGTLADYDSSKSSQVAGVVCGIDDNGKAKVISLDDSDITIWGESIDLEGIENVNELDLLLSFTSTKVVSSENANKAYYSIDSQDLKKQYSTILTQFDELITDTSYQGMNLLTGGELKVTFNENRTHNFTVKGKDIRSDKIGLTDEKWKNKKNVEKSIQEVIEALNQLRSFSAELGNNYAIIQTRQTFTSALIDVLETGADNLVLADMNEASAQYLMLQTRQQLATNSLSLAYQSAQSILSLF